MIDKYLFHLSFQKFLFFQLKESKVYQIKSYLLSESIKWGYNSLFRL